jgi:hypothetical protein
MTTAVEMKSALQQGKVILQNKHLFVNKWGNEIAELAESMLTSAYRNYLKNFGSISAPHWMEIFGKDKVKPFNEVLKVLCDNGWLTSEIKLGNKFAEIKVVEEKLVKYLGVDGLAKVRRERKLESYLPTVNVNSIEDNITKRGKDYYDSGLKRPGMAKAAKTQFYYDSAVGKKYIDGIIRNANKGMTKVREKYPKMRSTTADYDAVSVDVIEKLFNETPMLNMGANVSDPRGRAVKKALSKVANPIGYKSFRALMVIPVEDRVPFTDEDLEAVYLFVAELHGSKNVSVEQKALEGKAYYEEKELPAITDKDLHEVMWLERTYAELDKYYNHKLIAGLMGSMPIPFLWSVPIELDASASMLSYIGCLLGDRRLLEMTNTLYTGIMNDPWHMDTLSRVLVKAAATPLLYGSMQSIVDLWNAAKRKDESLSYTYEDIKHMQNELQNGALGLANEFKNFIIKNVKPSSEMTLQIHNDTFKVKCNRTKHVTGKLMAYQVYNSATGTYDIIYNAKDVTVPDLDAFKTWFVTGLIHNLDSQVMDKVIGKVIDKYEFGLDIHDAIICSPSAARDVRRWYSEEMQLIYNNRKVILSRYFKSIGIGEEAAVAFKKLMDKVQPVDSFVCSPWALK